MLSEFAKGMLREAYFAPHQLDGLRVSDPFMGGTPLFEANRSSCDVVSWDVYPMGWSILRQEITHLDLCLDKQEIHQIECHCLI